jgi:hypothetical protein
MADIAAATTVPLYQAADIMAVIAMIGAMVTDIDGIGIGGTATATIIDPAIAQTGRIDLIALIGQTAHRQTMFNLSPPVSRGWSGLENGSLRRPRAAAVGS